MLAAMKTRPESEWKALFKGLRLEQQDRIVGCMGAEQLLQLQAHVKALQAIEQFFLTEMLRK